MKTIKMAKHKCRIFFLLLVLHLTVVSSADEASTSTEFISSTIGSALTTLDDELIKKSTIELESETSDISFGIKSFTVEVSPATEKTIEEKNSTQSDSNLTITTTDGNDELTTLKIVESTASGDNDEETTSKIPDNNDNDDDHSLNEIHVEKNKKNGLYRIKIAEITTDEFDNGLHEAENDNILMTHKVYPQEINIYDFYPSKLEDFKPVIEASNEKLLREKNILRNEEVSNEKLTFEATLMKPQDFLPITTDNNKGTDEEATISNTNDNNDISTTKIEIELIDDTSSTNSAVISDDNENGNNNNEDDVDEDKKPSSEIKLPESDNDIKRIMENFDVTTATMMPASTVAPPLPTPAKIRINTNEFIPRRVKKNDPKTKVVANTKFNTDSATSHDDKKNKPEFSTTKFYNSKELYSELHHQMMNDSDSVSHKNANKSRMNQVSKSTAVVSEKDIISAKTISAASKPSIQSVVSTSSAIKKMTTTSKSTATTSNRLNNKDIELKKKILKTNIVPIENNDGNNQTKSFSSSINKPNKQMIKQSKLSTPTKTSSPTTSTPAVTQPVIVENLIVRPHTLSRLQEKINSLDCDLQNLSPESTIWRGNETHELNLPIHIPFDCTSGQNCTISWEGIADIQSGDILIVEIDDKQLIGEIKSNRNGSETQHHNSASVYQVTRLGHENCDITEGVLLDITPLVVDEKKLVTLYDKDLTEGMNLLIVVAEQWGHQCVRLKVTVKSDNCGENADCSGKGVCYSNNSMEGYECQCCSGFAGSHCEEIDACTPSPCTNNGICVDLSQGHEGNAYQCLCPYGYTGKNCQFESDPCNPSQCLNGGTCVGNSTHFRCECTPGYTGPLCQHNLNECESSPCVHGICVDQEDGFRCFCQPGFSGELCNFEYNECESNPCINGGTCEDKIAGFVCSCTRGYTGKRCHIKVDFCANDPCPDGHRCIDHGDDFTCECPGGRNGPDCNQVPRTLCSVNPCSNGGTCWTTEESFYCACRPGFTGKMCEETFVIDTVVSSSELLSDVNDDDMRNYVETQHIGKHGTIELHNAYIAAGTLAAAVLIVAIVVTACHCKVHKSYRNFTTKHRQLIPIFGRKNKSTNINRHWLTGKGQHTEQNNFTYNSNNMYQHQHPNSYNLQQDRIINRPLPMNLENDMYYTVDFSDSQNAPLIQ